MAAWLPWQQTAGPTGNRAKHYFTLAENKWFTNDRSCLITAHAQTITTGHYFVLFFTTELTLILFFCYSNDLFQMVTCALWCSLCLVEPDCDGASYAVHSQLMTSNGSCLGKCSGANFFTLAALVTKWKKCARVWKEGEREGKGSRGASGLTCARHLIYQQRPSNRWCHSTSAQVCWHDTPSKGESELNVPELWN